MLPFNRFARRNASEKAFDAVVKRTNANGKVNSKLEPGKNYLNWQGAKNKGL